MTADELIQSLRKRDIICPYPILWNKMVLHFDKILGNKVKLPNPLVLSGWDVSNNYEKRKRFEEHITIISETLGVKTLTRYLDRFVNEKKLRLVHDKSEFRKNIKEIYEIFLKQKEMLRGKDIHDFCSDAVYNLDPIIFDSKKN